MIICFRVELSLGSSKGQTDILPFKEAQLLDGMYILSSLALLPSSIVYVTAKLTNGVDRYTVVGVSDPVVISPQPRLDVSLNITFESYKNTFIWF